MTPLRFILDVGVFDDPATLLPLPVSAEPNSVRSQDHEDDKEMSENLQLLDELNAALSKVNLSYVNLVNANIASVCTISSHLAASLVSRNPTLFQYGVEEMDAAEVILPMHGHPSIMAVSAHTSQLEPQENAVDSGVGGDCLGTAQAECHETMNTPAAKKRARRGARSGAYVMMSDEAEAAAAKLGFFLERCVEAASNRPDDKEAEGGDEWKGVNRGKGARRRTTLHLDVLQNLHGQLLTAQSQGYLHLVPTPALQQLLLTLHGNVEQGRKRLLAESTELESASLSRVTAELEAMLCELVVYATPRLHQSLYVEEVLCCAVEVMQYHLQCNVLSLHDARFKRLYRPEKDAKDDEELNKPAKHPRSRGAAAPLTGRYAPSWTSVLVGQLEQALSLLSQVIGLVRMDAERLIPLVRISQLTLSVPSLQTLHCRALGLTVSMFKHYPLHRETVLGQLVDGLLTHMSAVKNLARCFPLQTADNTTKIQMSTALVMQLIQVTAELPQAESLGSNPLMPANLAASWAGTFWTNILSKLPSARTPKADATSDVRAWLDALVDDLLTALPLPEWPVATVLLRRLVYIIRKDHLASDSVTNVVCIELLGMVARRLHLLNMEARTPDAEQAVNAAIDDALASFQEEVKDAHVDRNEVAQELLLEHLAAEGAGAVVAGFGHDGGNNSAAAEADTSITGSARRLIACNMLLERCKDVERQQKDQLEGVKVEDSILRYRQIYERQRSCLSTSTFGFRELKRDTAISLSRWLVANSVLGFSRCSMLRWLADVGGSGRSQKEPYPAAARTKSIKLLGGVIEVDVSVLSLSDVQVGLTRALHDDSVSVRESALDVIGKHISRSQDLASQFYDVLAHAAADTGLTVRKRAVRLLWECCVRCPNFNRRNEAMLLIMSCASDVEDTMRDLVNKICSEVWFLPHFQLEGEEGSSQVSRGAEQRAAQLGDVVMAVYNRMGYSNSVPFPSNMPVVAAMRNILEHDGKPEFATVLRGAKEVADTLLARALELQGEQDAPSQDGPSAQREAQAPADELFQCLLALHAMCVVEPKLLYKPEDPQRVIRCLAPYIKEVPQWSNDQAGRRKREQLLAVLAVLGGCIGALRHVDDELANDVVQDLRRMIGKVVYVQAVTVACQCLCAMASLKPRHRETLRGEALYYYRCLDEDIRKQVISSADRQPHITRVLYILGTLCRFGADILDDASEGLPQVTCASALDLVLRLYNLMDDNMRVKETALQALGFIFIARPQLAVSVRDVGPVFERALDRSQPPSIKARCLTSLTELLRSEEDSLVVRQNEAKREDEAAQQASTLPSAEVRELARRNGEGDTSSVSSGIIQMLWDKILALATDTTPAPTAITSGQTPPPTPSGTASAHGAVVRLRALELIKVAMRAGIVVPWTAMPALCALATDPERVTSARALDELRSIVSANTTFVAGQVPRGVAEAYAFHSRLWALERPGQALAPEKCRSLVDGLSAVWASIFQQNKTLKAMFLTALLKPLDEGCTLAAGLAAKSDPHLLTFVTYVIAELEYRRMDELLVVLVRVNDIVRRRADEVLDWFQKLQGAARASKGAEEGDEAAAAPAPVAAPSGSSPCLAGVVKAALALSLLLWLKQFLRISYDVTADRIDKFEQPGPHRKDEEKRCTVHNRRLRFTASKLPIDVAARMGGHGMAPGGAISASVMKAAADLAAAGGGPGGAGAVSVLDPGVVEVYKVFKSLMKQDDAESKQGVHAEADAEIGGSPLGANALQGVAINLEKIMAAPDSVACGAKKPPLASSTCRSRGRGRGTHGRDTPRTCESTGRGRRQPSSGNSRASAITRRGVKRKVVGMDDSGSDSTGSDSTDDDGDDVTEQEHRVEHRKPPATKRKRAKA